MPRRPHSAVHISPLCAPTCTRVISLITAPLLSRAVGRDSTYTCSDFIVGVVSKVIHSSWKALRRGQARLLPDSTSPLTLRSSPHIFPRLLNHNHNAFNTTTGPQPNSQLNNEARARSVGRAARGPSRGRRRTRSAATEKKKTMASVASRTGVPSILGNTLPARFQGRPFPYFLHGPPAVAARHHLPPLLQRPRARKPTLEITLRPRGIRLPAHRPALDQDARQLEAEVPEASRELHAVQKPIHAARHVRAGLHEQRDSQRSLSRVLVECQFRDRGLLRVGRRSGQASYTLLWCARAFRSGSWRRGTLRYQAARGKGHEGANVRISSAYDAFQQVVRYIPDCASLTVLRLELAAHVMLQCRMQ
jgi:hypothetical protein